MNTKCCMGKGCTIYSIEKFLQNCFIHLYISDDNDEHSSRSVFLIKDKGGVGGGG